MTDENEAVAHKRRLVETIRRAAAWRAEVARRSEPEHAKASARSAHSLRALARFVENDLGGSDPLLSRTLRRSRVADDGSYYVISQDALRVLGRFGIGRGFPTPPRREQFVNVLNRLEGEQRSRRVVDGTHP